MEAKQFSRVLVSRGYNFFTGVPCSIFKGLIKTLSEDPSYGYIPAVREDIAVGLASGAYLGGRKPVVIMQNSGLGYCLNALMSLNMIYRIPLLLLISWRGYQGRDAPEHLVIGKVLPALLDTVGIAHCTPDSDNLETALDSADEYFSNRRELFALLCRKGVIK